MFSFGKGKDGKGGGFDPRKLDWKFVVALAFLGVLGFESIYDYFQEENTLTYNVILMFFGIILLGIYNKLSSARQSQENYYRKNLRGNDLQD